MCSEIKLIKLFSYLSEANKLTIHAQKISQEHSGKIIEHVNVWEPVPWEIIIMFLYTHPYWDIVAMHGYMAATNPLPEAMLTYHQHGPLTFIPVKCLL